VCPRAELYFLAGGRVIRAIGGGSGVPSCTDTVSELCTKRFTSPFLREVELWAEDADPDQYPFSIPAFSHGILLELTTAVTFFVGENGSGKSTLLEAVADHCGFSAEGGSKNHRFGNAPGLQALSPALHLSWLPKVTRGFFLRAESFFNFASYIDALARDDFHSDRAYKPCGGKSLHEQSHGESFLALFANRFQEGIYILDEPEAALSPQRQLSLLKIIHDLELTGGAKFLIAAHSPMLLAYPGATIFDPDGDRIQPIAYEDTQHYRLMKDFLSSPERFFRHLFAAEEGAPRSQ
jgi:predicted ATPase